MGKVVQKKSSCASVGEKIVATLLVVRGGQRDDKSTVALFFQVDCYISHR